ncbi:hypothetical protein PG985_010865 [Apiospora marii]|uniref:uncharacterized protein n=1 Tax=Apiospora marii TaxID=335849 RepID=UPI00312E81B1
MSAPNAFEKALAAFNSELTDSERAQFQFATSQDVRVAILTIQAEQRRSKKIINLTRIQGVIEAMEQLGKVLEVFLNSSDILAFVWGPMKLILLTASTWAESLDTLLDAYEQISDHLPILQKYEDLFRTQPEMQAAVEMIWADVLRFHSQALRIFKQRTLPKIFKSMWKTFKSDFHQILEQLQRHRELLDSQALQVHIQSLQTYQRDREVLLEHQRLQRIDETQRRFLSLVNWIAPADSHVDHEQLVAVRESYPGTGNWIIEQQQVKCWIESSIPASSSLWLHGIPGAGKTILASTVVSSLLRRKSPSTLVAYFFCREMDPSRNNTLAILKGLLFQFINQSRPFMPIFYERYIESGHASLTSTKMAKELLQLMCQFISRGFIVIDGLDECEERHRKESIDFAHDMVRSCDAADPGKLRVLFTSRDEPDIRRSMTPATIVGLQAKDMQQDISIYVDAQTERLREAWRTHGGLSENDIEYIKRNVQDRADGMFLYAKLVIENLLAQVTIEELAHELEPNCFPTGLQEAYVITLSANGEADIVLTRNRYNRTIARMERHARPGERDAACKVLGWMLCSHRPLYWREIQAAIAMNTVHQTIDDHRRLRTHIREICGSLIEIMSGGQVQFIHATASMYIAQSGFVSKGSAELSLSILCMHYLTFECFEDTGPEALRVAAQEGHFAFQDYATAHWTEHFINAVHLDEQDLTEATKNEFCDALVNFESRYDEDLDVPTSVDTERVSKAWAMVDCPQTLKRIFDHSEQVSSWKDDRRDVVSLPSLKTAFVRNREVLEHMLAGLPQESQYVSQQLSTIYGLNWYKCPKVTCYYFHRGFASVQDRESHVDRHTRPFKCAEEDCREFVFGFQSQNELDKHRFKLHPGQDALSTLFSRLKKSKENQQLANDMSARRHIQKHPATFQCTLCPKRFTRAYNLRSHLRTHTDERPFVCTVCGKSFARQNDRKRHEKLHDNEKKFVCKGDLGTGGQWGCGRLFRLPKDLGNHFRTETGRTCIKPLVDEEMMRRSGSLPQLGGQSSRLDPSEQYEFLSSMAAVVAEGMNLQGNEIDQTYVYEESVDMELDE